MKRIGIISDTHSYWDDKYLEYFETCDEIWPETYAPHSSQKDWLPSAPFEPYAATVTEEN